MFTLKLYRRKGPDSSEKTIKVLSVDHMIVHEIGEKKRALELLAFTSDHDYQTYFVGEPSEGMWGYGRDDLHLDSEPNSWWGWGLLENAHGNTTEHYRPASYGL